MSGLIEEIQRDASDDATTVAQLLRRVKIAASKLRLGQMEIWVEHELNGYPDDEKLPDYRLIAGVPMVHHVMHGWRLMALGPDEDINKAFLFNPFGASIAEVEAHTNTTGHLIISFPEFLERMTLPHLPGVDKIGLSVDQGKFRAVLNGVRNRCLDWSLAMETAGVTGEGMSFSVEEKEAAQTVTNNFYGDNARLNLNSTDKSTNQVIHGSVFGDLRTQIAQGVADENDRQALLDAVSKMEETKNTGAFAAAYAAFVGLAADHIQIVQWALPALATYIAVG